MGMSTEELQDYKDSLANLSAEELRGQLGDNEEQDTLINAVLGAGKAVEIKGAPAAGEDDDAGQIKSGAHHGIGDGAEDDDDDDTDDDTDTDPDAAPAAVDAVPEAAPVVDTPAVEEVPELAPEAAPVVELAPLNLSYLDAKREAEFAKLDAAKAEGLTKLMAGEIEAAEYAKIDAQYMRDRDAVRENLKAEAEWVTETHSFKATALTATGINYDADKEKAGALDDWLKRLADKPETANWTGQQFLQAAHKKVLAEFDIAPKAAAPAPAAQPAPAAKPAPVVKKGRAPDLSAIPPSLGALPAASNPGAGDGGEFAHLDNLTGMAYERALAGLSADQKARYEAA